MKDRLLTQQEFDLLVKEVTKRCTNNVYAYAEDVVRQVLNHWGGLTVLKGDDRQQILLQFAVSLVRLDLVEIVAGLRREANAKPELGDDEVNRIIEDIADNHRETNNENSES
jgi:hypothetical protein